MPDLLETVWIRNCPELVTIQCRVPARNTERRVPRVLIRAGAAVTGAGPEGQERGLPTSGSLGTSVLMGRGDPGKHPAGVLEAGQTPSASPVSHNSNSIFVFRPKQARN